MSPAEILRRLQEWALLSADRAHWQAVDMSPEAVDGRLRMQGGLTAMCLILGRASRVSET
jgi:hypothetical protein